MNAETFHELERESISDLAQQELRDRAQRVIQKRLDKMTESQQVLILTDEEDRMIRSFRRFKTNLRKDGEVFKWQTAREVGVVLAEDTALIHHPNEVSA